MIKLVIADGCSLTAGADLPDWEMTEEGVERSNYSWAACIKNTLFPDATFWPIARTGSSNSHIRRRSLFYLSEALKTYKPEEILYLVMWSDPARIEFRIQENKPTKDYEMKKDTDESHYLFSLPIDIANTTRFSNSVVSQADRNRWLAENRVLRVFSDYNLYHVCAETSLYYTFTEIETIRNFCSMNNICAYETSGFGHIVAQYWEIKHGEDKFLNRLIDVVDPTNTIHHNGRQEGMLEYAHRKGFKVGLTSHPLEETHSSWARSFIKHHRLEHV